MTHYWGYRIKNNGKILKIIAIFVYLFVILPSCYAKGILDCIKFIGNNAYEVYMDNPELYNQLIIDFIFELERQKELEKKELEKKELEKLKYLKFIPQSADFVIKINVSKVLVIPEVQNKINEIFKKEP